MLSHPFRTAFVVGLALIALVAFPGKPVLGAGALPGLDPAADSTGNCAEPGSTSVTFSLDGVSLTACLPFQPDYVESAAPDSPVQSAVAVRWQPYRSLAVYAAPFGVQPASPLLPTAQAHIAQSYAGALDASMRGEGQAVLGRPAASLFGARVTGITHAGARLVATNETEVQTTTTWVTEAGDRVWIVSEAAAGEKLASTISPDANASITLTATGLERPSASLAALAEPAPAALPPVNPLTPEAGDLPSPSWWNGDCNANNHPGSYPLGASYRGVKACGPIGLPATEKNKVDFGVGVPQYEWQCTEYSKRYLYLAYGIPPYSANGKDVVRNYSGNLLDKIANGTVGRAPRPGDVLSYDGPIAAYGHTSVVSWSTVDGSGNGQIGIVEQNYSAGGARQHKVANWYVQSNDTVSAWLQPKGSSGSTCPAPDNGTPRDGVTLNNRQVTFTWTPPACSGIDYYTFRVATHSNLNDGPWFIDHGVGGGQSSTTENIPAEYEKRDLYWSVWAHNSSGYSPMGGPWRFRVDTSAPPPPPPLPSGAWQVEYYRDKELTDRCATAGYDNTFVFADWGDGAPSGGCNSDHWGARFSRRVHLSAGSYTFAIEADDWGRFYVNGDLVVNKWNGATQHYESRWLNEGDYDLRIEFADTLGAAKISGWWWGPGYDIPHEERDPNQWFAEYWLNRDQWWDAFARRNEGSGRLEHDWAYGGPGWNMPADNFSTRFRRQVYFECGRYRFQIYHDDGVRLQIDNILRLDRWHNWGSDSVDVDLTRGNHELQVDHYEGDGYASLTLDWSQLSGCSPSAPAPQSPGVGEQVTYGSPVTLAWSGASGADEYYARLWSDTAFDANSGWAGNTQWFVGVLPAGSYTWYVRARNSYGDSPWSTARSFTVAAPPPPAADFEASPANGTGPLTVSFRNRSTGSYDTCQWSYGDGQTAGTCEYYHEHVYTEPGTYTVELVVAGPGGSTHQVQSDLVHVTPTVTPHGWRTYLPLVRGAYGQPD